MQRSTASRESLILINLTRHTAYEYTCLETCVIREISVADIFPLYPKKDEESLEASSGWLHKFDSVMEFDKYVLQGESLSADTPSADTPSARHFTINCIPRRKVKATPLVKCLMAMKVVLGGDFCFD